MPPSSRSLYVLIVVLLAAFRPVYSQERCGTVEYNKRLLSGESEQVFEQWLEQKKAVPKNNQPHRKQAAQYEIPVVVHVIHNGEPVGTGTNIPDEQILSQIKVLNEDFKRLNSDAANTPSEFEAVAGSLDIEFVLARRDPEGLPTTGIVRAQGSRTSWTVNDNYQLKAISYWPAEDYLNIWVCNITDFLGYSQFPVSDLPGLENSSYNALTDGVVIWYRSFGSIEDGAFNLHPRYNRGRTATHEVAHFFGLRHIWGDDGNSCSGTDYVDDTPNQGGSTSGCPNHPATSCDTHTMFQNFLDYTDDACMNLFTRGQVDRMTAVIENSPRRKSLLTSPALDPPASVANDLGIRKILAPSASTCNKTITPQIEIRNYGNNNVTSARIQLSINGHVTATQDFILDLEPLESTTVTFNTITVTEGLHTATFAILLTNGGADGYDRNNLRTAAFTVFTETQLPFVETFDSSPSSWMISNPDQLTTWETAFAPSGSGNNRALHLNFYGYGNGFGEVDVFLTPVFDLTNAETASLTFDVAYARYSTSRDRLRVAVLTGCSSVESGTIVYDKAGSDLATVPNSMSQAFVPGGASEWRREMISLNAFVGQSGVQLAFIGINDWGNNLYIDNISVVAEDSHDLVLKSLIKPSPITCQENPVPQIRVQNSGTLTITDFKVVYQLNSGTAETFAVNGVTLPFGEEMTVTLPPVQLEEGNNILSINLVEPNGLTDLTPDNNQGTYTLALQNTSERIPLRETFEQPFDDLWTIINPGGGMKWNTVSTDQGKSLYFNAFDNTQSGDQAWLVSPVLDFSHASEASMLFDLSHARRAGKSEALDILISVDCGTTFEKLNYSFPTFPTQSDSWLPSSQADWEKGVMVRLDPYAGEASVRIAFVVTNANGNNLYLDNIEFFTTSQPANIDISTPFAVYGYDLADPSKSELKITFNLPERQDVVYQVIDVLGRPLATTTLPDVLNQTYPLGLEELASGVYFIRLLISGKYYSTKVLVTH